MEACSTTLRARAQADCRWSLAGTVIGNIQNVNTLTLNGSIGTPSGTDSLALKYYTVTLYPAQ